MVHMTPDLFIDRYNRNPLRTHDIVFAKLNVRHYSHWIDLVGQGRYGQADNKPQPVEQRACNRSQDNRSFLCE